MTNANGFNEIIYVGLETTFKNPPGSPAGYKLAVANPMLKPTVQRFRSEALGGSAEPRQPVDGKVGLTVTFDLECSYKSLGPVISGLMGSESVQGAGSYRDHVSYLGTPQSWYVEQNFSDIDLSDVGKGCRYDKIDFDIPPEGIMKASVSLRGALMSVVTGGSAPFTVTPTDKSDAAPLSYLFGELRYNGSSVLDAQEIKISVDRGAEEVKTLNGSNELTDIITKIATVKGSCKFLFTNQTYLNDALNSSERSLEVFIPSETSGYGVWISLSTLKLEPAGPVTNGPGGLVTQEFNFDAYGSASTSKFAAFSASAPFVSKAITSSNDIFIVDIDAAGDITVDVPDGTYTPTSYAAALNADTGFNVKGVARAMNGRVVIESLTKGSTSKVQVKTCEANTDFLAFSTSLYAGADNKSIRFVVMNADSAVYNA